MAGAAGNSWNRNHDIRFPINTCLRFAGYGGRVRFAFARGNRGSGISDDSVIGGQIRFGYRNYCRSCYSSRLVDGGIGYLWYNLLIAAK